MKINIAGKSWIAILIMTMALASQVTSSFGTDQSGFPDMCGAPYVNGLSDLETRANDLIIGIEQINNGDPIGTQTYCNSLAALLKSADQLRADLAAWMSNNPCAFAGPLWDQVNKLRDGIYQLMYNGKCTVDQANGLLDQINGIGILLR